MSRSFWITESSLVFKHSPPMDKMIDGLLEQSSKSMGLRTVSLWGGTSLISSVLKEGDFRTTPTHLYEFQVWRSNLLWLRLPWICGPCLMVWSSLPPVYKVRTHTPSTGKYFLHLHLIIVLHSICLQFKLLINVLQIPSEYDNGSMFVLDSDLA